jgi:predicted dehydrogenase
MGTGFWAHEALVPALRLADDVELVACVGREEHKTKIFASEHGIRAAYDSLEALLRSPDRPDLLVIAAPDDVHAPATRLALTEGIPVFCEKPLANDAKTAFGLAELAASTGVAATVGFSFRYSPAVQALRRDLLDGVLGDAWLIELFEYNSQFHPSNGKQMNWKGDPAHARGGALFEYASHVIDLASWLVGPIERISSSLTRVLPGARLDDIATLQLRFEAPAIGIAVAGWVLAGDVPGIRIRMHGSKGLGELELSRAVPGSQVYRRIGLDGRTRGYLQLEPLGGELSGYAARHVADFVGVLRGRPSGDDTLPTLASGASVQAVLEAALVATDAWVDV